MTLDDLIIILQASIAPVVLISGVGLLLLTMTNRLGRTIDRIRHLCNIKEEDAKDRVNHFDQIRILYARARYQRTAIFLATASIVATSIIIFVLFAASINQVNLSRVVIILFEGALLALTFSLVYLLLEVWASLRSIDLEIKASFGKAPA
jgi:hypothetical protein